MREEGDERGRNNGQQRCRDGGRSGCVIFGMRVGTTGFRKKISMSHIYVILKKVIIIIKKIFGPIDLTQALTWMGCGPIWVEPIGLDSIRAANFIIEPFKISGQFKPAHRTRLIFSALICITPIFSP